MNNAWATIACRACSVTARAPQKPIQQFFRETQRYRSAFAGSTHLLSRAPQWPTTSGKTSSKITARCKSNASAKAAAGKGSPRISPYRPTDRPGRTTRRSAELIVKPANTVASHTEGTFSPEDLDKGLTWRDYDPQGGMPLPQGEVSAEDIGRIFGDNVNVETGNYILSVMHWRRSSGALIDVGLDFPKEMNVTRQMALDGLEYVRSLNPGFDEQSAGENWAMEESERLKETLRQRAVDLKLIRPEEGEEVYEEESAQGTQQGRERTGESVLQTQRQAKEIAWEQEQAETAARREREEQAAMHSSRGPLELSGGVQPSASLITGGPNNVAIAGAQTKAWLQPVERKEWVKYYERQAHVIKENIVPDLSLIKRLVPGILFAISVLVICAYVADNYTPAPASARMFPDTPPAIATVAALTAALCTIFVLGRLPPLWRTSSKYFTIVPAYPYTVSLLGAAFRHDQVRHLLSNVLVLWIFGVSLHEEVGRGTFLAIFFGSAVCGGYTSLMYNVLWKNWLSYIFGSSGGVLGVVGASCLLKPEGKLNVFGYELVFGAWILGGLWILSEAIAAFRTRKTTIDHAGHVGGMLAGFVGAAYLKRQASRGETLLSQSRYREEPVPGPPIPTKT